MASTSEQDNEYSDNEKRIRQIFEDSSGSEFSGYHSSEIEDRDSSSSESDIGQLGVDREDEWSDRIGLRQIKDFNMLPDPCLPRNFDVDTAVPLEYFALMMNNDM